MNRQIFRTVLPAVICGLVGTAWAAGSGDPTEAPQEWVAAQPAYRGGAATATQDATPVMQLILTSRSRKLAVIEGELLKVGDEYKGSKVLSIHADKVVMEDAEKSLGVTPNVKKSVPSVIQTKKKSVVIPAGVGSSKAIRE